MACGGHSRSAGGTGAGKNGTEDAGCAGTRNQDGRCVVTLASGQSPKAIAVGGGAVYWINDDGASTATLMRVSVDGGKPETLATNLDQPIRLAVDDSSVYWLESSTLKKLPLSGGDPVILASGLSPLGIAVDGTSVYWLSAHRGSCIQPCDAVMKVPLDGGAPTNVVTQVGELWDFVIDGTNVYWFEDHGYENGYAAPGPWLLRKAPLTGGGVVTLATLPNFVEALAVDATRVYWTETGGSPARDSLNTVPLDGGTVETLATDLRLANNVLVDGNDVYWTANIAGTQNAGVTKLPLSGGPEVLASDPASTHEHALAIDATAVYWANEGDILRITPK